MPWDPSNFEDRLANLRQVWAHAERTGKAVSEADKVFDELSLELEFSGRPLVKLENVASYARLWFETKNPHYIDAAFMVCGEVGIAPPPLLLRLMRDVAAMRFAGLETGGTGKRIRDQAILGEALRIVCCLHWTGLPVETAASKAAQYLADQQLGKLYKASTLQREYASRFRKGEASIEKAIFSTLDEAPSDVRQEWQRLSVELPEAGPNLVGERR